MFETEGLAVLYGLLSAASFGTADFGGGLATRKQGVLSVIFTSQAVGLSLLLGVALLLEEPFPPLRALLFGAVAGIAGAAGLGAMYSGLARGRMGVVAPTAAMMTGVLPLLVSLVTEVPPSAAQLGGFALALTAVFLLTRAGPSQSLNRIELGYSTLAGIGFGLFFVLIDMASDDAILWPLVSARIASVTLMLGLATFLGKLQKPAAGGSYIIVMAGLFDATGNAFFALSTRAGRLDIATIISSLYPAVTVLLAWLLLKERLKAQQRLGVLVALVALALIAA